MADQGGGVRRSGASRKIKVAMELRPALEGFAGIPQETRLEFAAFAHSNVIEPVGVLNPQVRRSAPGIPFKSQVAFAARHKQYARLSRHVISYDESPVLSRFDRIKLAIEDRIQHHSTGVGALFGLSEDVRRFVPDGFENFLWTRLFSKTLPVSDFNAVTSKDFWTLRTAWSTAQRAGLFWNVFPAFRFADADVFVSQTPWPGRVVGGAIPVVRYHDAIPIFFPQYITDKVIHQFTHYQALVKNMRRGAKFVCVSRAVANDLLKMFPQAEGQVDVIYNVASHQYFVADAPAHEVSEIIRARSDKETCPKFLTVRERDNFYTKHAEPSKLRFLLTVSTIEPRKNHGRLIAAWELLRRTRYPDLKLVIVGTLGWDYEKIVDSMRGHIERGSIFHLSGVPSPDLRMLYRFADAVVCPSYAEGFDLSGVEAMLCGGAVVASDIPVHREVYERCASYFDPLSTRACFDRIGEVLEPAIKKSAELRVLGPPYAKRYSRESILPQWENYFERLRSERSKIGVEASDRSMANS